MRRLMATTITATLIAGLAACSNSTTDNNAETTGTDASPSEVINVYSSRHYDVDKEVYKKFEEETGLKLNVVEGKSGELVERIIREKNNPAADVFLTVGAESIWQLNEEDAIGASTNDTINTNIPEHYRGDNWMGIVSRARVIAYSKDRVDPSTITSYDDLTKPEWKGKVLARSSSNSYNQALLASFISLWGEDKAKQWAQGVVDNFARDPKGNDRDQAKAVAAGEGDLAIMNSYYWALMANSSDPEMVKVSEEVGLIFPEKTHLNISYASVLKGAKNKDNALKFLEYLSSAQTQEFIASRNGEFPLNPDATMPEPQKSWGTFTIQDLDFETLGEFKTEATRTFDEVGWK